MKRVFYNAYKLELPERFDISLTFNIVDLYEFIEGEKGDDEVTLDEWEQHLPIKMDEEMEKILENNICQKTHRKEYLDYLITWKNRGPKGAS